jgi:hypothetical protein
MIIYLPLLISIIGLLMYVLASNPKIVEIGRIMFWTGLLAFLMGGGAIHATQGKTGKYSQQAHELPT